MSLDRTKMNGASRPISTLAKSLANEVRMIAFQNERRRGGEDEDVEDEDEDEGEGEEEEKCKKRRGEKLRELEEGRKHKYSRVFPCIVEYGCPEATIHKNVKLLRKARPIGKNKWASCGMARQGGAVIGEWRDSVHVSGPIWLWGLILAGIKYNAIQLWPLSVLMIITMIIVNYIYYIYYI